MRLWAVAFLTGVVIVQQLKTLPAFYWAGAGLFISTLCYWLRFRFHTFLLALKFIVGLLLGFSWALGYAHWLLSDRLLAEYEGVDLLVEGVVSSLPKSHQADHGKQPTLDFNFDVTQVISPAYVDASHFPARLRLSWYRASVAVKAGQAWRLSVRLKRPYGMMNPGGFDYESWLFQKRIQAKGYVRKNTANQKLTEYSSYSLLHIKILQLRQAILDKLTQSVQHNRLIKNLTAALILGYRGGMDAGQWRVFQRTGTIHLMAISGLHIGLVAGLVYFLFGGCWRLAGRVCLVVPAPQVAAIAALLAAIVYAMLAGFTIPTQRALIMLSVGLFHIIFRRVPVPASQSIALALVLVLLIDPLAVLAQGFWLSFFAVSLILFLIGQSAGQKLKTENSAQNHFYPQVFERFVTFVRIQWILSLAILPLVLFYYQSSSLVSPLANFFAIPLMSFVLVPLMFIATISLFINDSLANLLFGFIGEVFKLLWWLLEQLSGWHYATVESAIPSVWWLVPAYLALTLLLLKKGAPMRWLAVIFILPLIFPAKTPLATGEAKLAILDVGQGLAAVVQTQNHTLVYDAGPRYSRNFDTGRAVIVPYLIQQGQSTVDTFVISHADNDHIGGFASVADVLTVKKVLTSVPQQLVASDNMRVAACHAGQNWDYDGVQFAILSPLELTEAANGHDENNMSCVLKVSSAFGSVLLTGDIERETESYLYHAMPEQLKADILVVPHHGSQTSSLKRFIQAVSPKFAVFPAGYRNRYRLPSKKVIGRYRKNSRAQLLQSYAVGALSFDFSAATALQPHLHRLAAQRYWHTRPVGLLNPVK